MEEIKFTKLWKNLIIATGVVSLVALIVSTFLLVITLGAINSNPNAKYARIVISKKYDKGQTIEKALKSEKETIAFFYVDWCGYCKRFAPQFHKVSKNRDFKKQYEIAYINCENPKNENVVKEYGIEAFPTVYLIKKDGEKEQISTALFYEKDFLKILKSE